MSKKHIQKSKEALKKAVELSGGVVSLSNQLGLHYTGISKWIYKPDVYIPIRHAIKIEKITEGKVKAKDLRPDVFE